MGAGSLSHSLSITVSSSLFTIFIIDYTIERNAHACGPLIRLGRVEARVAQIFQFFFLSCVGFRRKPGEKKGSSSLPSNYSSNPG